MSRRCLLHACWEVRRRNRRVGRPGLPRKTSASRAGRLLCMIGGMASVIVNLRIPSLMVKSADGSPAKRVDNSALRFLKTVELPSIPKPGEVLDMTAAAASAPFSCTVKRAEWDERENMFIVSCSYTKTSIPEADYKALVGSPDWASRPLI